ncbi:BON domain-containing protein [Caulobacter sp. RHG1]|uniref:BON domain-containing protein n=1 Tax=Caulobacter sp. (strain RHG1) TaxID=2545762 RepID=UPI001557B018|nr:BON domain-containing protein [Caulobacter sp. RHG1]NQE63913.1 hypothetical protein [Caulobacter sp. RHG1]
MPQRWNDREGRFDVEADGDFDRNREHPYDASRRRGYGPDDVHPGGRGRHRSSEFLRAAQQGGDIGYGRIRSGADYGGTSANRGWDRAGGHDFGGATGDYGSSGYSSRTADYGDERYFEHRDRDRYGYGGEYGRHNPYRSFGPNGAPNARDRAGYEEDRSWFDRARDEVSSWMGDHDAQRRRELDGEHRGRGPKGYRRSDDRIREDVSDRLTDDSWLDAQNIEVAVAASEVTLTGTVRSREDKKRAEALAESVSGVDNVQNNLRIDRGEAYATAVPITPPLG